MAESGGTDATVDPDADEERTIFTDRAKTGLFIAAFGVATSGLLDNLLTQAGAPGLGALVWAVGFGSVVIALWYVLLRPLNLGAETEG